MIYVQQVHNKSTLNKIVKYQLHKFHYEEREKKGELKIKEKYINNHESKCLLFQLPISRNLKLYVY